MLTDLIAQYHEAQRVWQAQFDEDDTKASNSKEWDAYEAAEDAILYYPCKTLEDVQTKASFVLADTNALDSVTNCFRSDDGAPSLVLFLRSLLGEPPVDNGGN
ncbi:hypothetical protein [Rhizobium sp. AP16]|uniref:hypothetical protein n=1 Tax=Rhizobium sp. AP16 TaxID=1144306 RepID=UPI00026ED267|nr:hypothetical protein [Rhizobium sp. AP16]EJK83564.1 hypothetical protein PMI03_03219 [Rhizobium sp. AP16]